MAQSPFLKYQDLNGDKLPDVCDDYIETTPGKKCPACTPSPTAATPNWKEQTEDDPWLNGKNCKYQTTIKTTSTTLILSEDDIESGDPAGSSILALLFSEYTEAAIDSLLFGFNKENSSEARQAIRDSIESTRFYLSPRPFSKVKLLYSVPYDVFNPLPEDDGTSMEEGTDDEQDDSTSENGADLPSKIVTYLVDDLVDQTRTVSQGLYLYNSYYKIYRAVDKGNLVFKDTDKLFNLDGYGHFFAGSSMVLDALNDLDAFLNKKKMNIPANLGGTYSFSNARVAKLELTFTGDYKLNQLRVWTENCGSQPKVFDKAKLKFLLQKQSYKNPTVMGYLSSLSEMESDLTARSPMPWLEFIKKFTYPTVEERTDFGGIGTATATDAAQARSCVGEALSSGAKQLGQDLLDDAFSMVDVIAYQFHKNMCKRSLGEETEERVRIGMIYDPDSGIEGENRTFFAFAEEQAYKELTQNKDICALFMGAASGEGPPESLERFYENSLAPLKLCGLNAMYLEVISCLMGQLPFEEAMSKILEATLRGMSWENFENLFIGLPHSKRVELTQLARSKLSSGNIFQNDSNMGTMARSIDNTALPGTPLTSHQLSSIELPWRRGNNPSPQGISLETDLPADINYSADTNFEEVGDPRYMTAEQLQAYSGQRSTLAQTFTAAGGGNLDNKAVFEAYIKAILETYNSDPFGLMAEIERMPGAQIMKNVLALTDCPRPPVLQPSFTDWIKDIQLPFCRNPGDVYMPVIQNPFGWMPKVLDINSSLWDGVYLAVQRAIISMLMKLMVKVCQTLGKAACDIVGSTGAIIAGGAGLGDRETFANIMREYLCGDQESPDSINKAITDLMSTVGPGAAAMANEAETINFAEDLSSAVTRKEMVEAFLGEPSEEFTDIAEEVLDEYEDFKEGLPNKQAIKDFFKDMGNVLPPDAKAAMRDFVEGLPEGDLMPANPVLCATPDQIAQACELRAQLLEGRATPGQIRRLCQEATDDAAADLGDVANALQDPLNGLGGMPPLVSQPGCNDGLIPFMTEEAAAVGGAALSGDLEQLKVAYATDMIGIGPWESDWGFFNLVLSDTNGYPYSTHVRKASNNKDYVDFFTDVADSGLPWQNPKPTSDQEGAFPIYVAEWLREQIENAEITFSATNDWQDALISKQSFKDAGLTDWYAPQNINLIKLSQPEYNVTYSSDYTGNGAIITEIHGRKKTADCSLLFYDNNSGETAAGTPVWNFGYKFDLYLNDLEKQGDSAQTNRFSNNSRVAIYNVENVAQTERKITATTDEDVESTLKYEFFTTDDSSYIESLNDDLFPRFMDSFKFYKATAPQIILLRELMENNSGVEITELDEIEALYNNIMSDIMTNLKNPIIDNEDPWLFGAAYDDLTKEDFKYVVPADYGGPSEPGTRYKNAIIEDEEEPTGERTLRNSDRILGVSYDQLINGDDARVIYLNPDDYGGTYRSPPFYVKPVPNTGWLGLIKSMFPDIGPCKPHDADFVDFEELSEKIQSTYQDVPEDERLMSDPECILEVPYNRVLDRYSKAGIEGLITATLQIFISMHMLKAFPTFLAFKPDFKHNFSTLYASYLIEVMQENLKDSAGTGGLGLASFSDDEFWYAFLEQCVQTYSRRVDDGSLTNPSEEAIKACEELNLMQQYYPFYTRDSLKDAVELGDEPWTSWIPGRRAKGLIKFKEEQVYERIQATEEKAKVVLKDLVVEQFNHMSEKFLKNLKANNLEPTYNRLDYYFLNKFVQGGESLDLDKEIIEEVEELGDTVEDYLYTTGAELSVAEVRDPESSLSVGSEYIGYYHIHEDEDGNLIYMAGEIHSDDPHDLLVPYAKKVSVPIGDVNSYPFTPDYISDRKFCLEKYIKVKGIKMDPDDAVSLIRNAGDPSDLLSTHFPGDLTLVYGPGTLGEVVGLTGELGVRYGLQFSIVHDTKYELVSVEIDALDLPISEMSSLEGNSKLLLCLLNKLCDDKMFKVVTGYIFPLKKLTSLWATYSDMSFLSSIGEVTVPTGDTLGNQNLSTKPGAHSYPTTVTDPETGEQYEDFTLSGNAGWASVKDRKEIGWFPWNWGHIQWDNWDREVLRNSRVRIKRLFDSYYNSREFKPGDPLVPRSKRPGRVKIDNLKSVFAPRPGAQLVPWWKKRKLRSNPYNSDGVLCRKEDSDE